MKKSGKTDIWPDKQDISWKTDDKLVATVAEPTISGLILFSILLQKYLKKILMKSNEISENYLFSYEF
jgi:hypothetical protein